MIEAERLVAGSAASPNEEAIERALRPTSLAEYVGQPKVREQLDIFIRAARNRQESLDHVLLFGPPGLGKTTLAHIVAREMGVNLRQTSGPVLERPGDLAALLTNLDKVLIPAGAGHPEATKRDLIRHYACMAPVLLPYVHDRPINLHRYPDGTEAGGFWHKARPDHAPDFIGSWRNEDADPDETQVYAVLDSPAALAWAANFGAIELHPWTSTTARPNTPTWAMIDIDPGSSTTFLSLDLVKTALGQFDLGPAAAMSIIYFLIILVFSWLFYTLMMRNEEK